MNKKYGFVALLFILLGAGTAQAQVPARRVDTTMKVGKSGYRVTCSNKSAERNQVSVKPLNFEKEAGDFMLEIKGRMPRAEVDDINRDGFPDLLVYVYGGDSLNKVSVIGIVSENNQGVAPVIMPDIYDDPKLRVGYKGNDSFFLMEGYLVRRFPLVATEGAPAPAPNMIRQVTYTVVRDERGGYRFKMMRSNDFAK